MSDVVAVLRGTLNLEVTFAMFNTAHEVPLVAGDTGPRLRFVLKDEAGAAVAVSGAGSSVSLYLRRHGEDASSNAGHEGCSAFDVPQGQWTYELQAGDVSAAGTYWGDVQVQYEDGRKETAFEAVRFLVRPRGRPA